MYGYRFPYWIPRFVKRTFFLRGLRMKVQRARRGFSDEDLWSFDHYICEVLSKGLHRLADTTHSYPGEWNGYATPEEWDDNLRTLSKALGGWTSHSIMDADSYEQELELYQNAQAALHKVADDLGSMWD